MAEKGVCLHCTLNLAIDGWVEKNAERNAAGEPIFNVGDIIAALAEVAGEYVEAPADRGQRRRALMFAHKALDASVKAARTGKPVEIQMDQVH